MPPRKYSLTATRAHEGVRLDQALAEWLPQALGQPVSKAKVRKLVVAGAVYLNGSRVRIASKPLRAGARVDAFVDLAKLMDDERGKDKPFQMSPEHVLFEDEHLIAVAKPPGLPTQPTLDEARDNLFAAVKRFLAARDRVAEAYVGLHHRLDRDTSGIVLFTKSTEANAGTAELFAGHLARKTYHAIAARPPRDPGSEWAVENHLGKAPGTGKRARFTAVRSGGDFAHTDFRMIEALPQALWVEAMPRTGRTHQIRVHLSEAGMPILGDATYGGAASLAPRLMLHALELAFPHPVTREPTRIQCPLPRDFEDALIRLGADLTARRAIP